MALRLAPSTIVLRDHPRSSDMAGRKMPKVNPPVLACMKRLRKATPTIYQP
jgi:hypothetical protein